MSELINNYTDRINGLYEFAHRLINGENGKMLVEDYTTFINSVSAAEAMHVLDKLLINGYSHELVKNSVGKIINVFHKSLSTLQWEPPGEDHFLHYLMLENREAEKLVSAIRPAIKSFFKGEGCQQERTVSQLLKFIISLKEYELHYIKKENILFPYLEKAFPQYRCLQLMWSFHDDFRRSLKALEIMLLAGCPDKEQFNKELGKLFFVILPIIFREEYIVFPVAKKEIPQEEWIEMLHQSIDIGWCYGVNPVINDPDIKTGRMIKGKINLNTGFLTPEQIILLLNNQPVDITYVDEFDEVCYFSGGRHRIFPRSKAIIGRKVQNCHPPESVHVVNEIIEAFRNGTKEHADFWIRMKGLFIHIRYFALRNEQGEYKGTLEVSQDVTEIKQLEGERRLLDWEK